MSNTPNFSRDDPTPKPPGPDTQALPPRPAAFSPTPGNIQFARCAHYEGQTEPIIMFVYDSPDARVVSYWGESAFLSMAQRMTRFVADGAPQLTIADEMDLQALKDASPFLDGP